MHKFLLKILPSEFTLSESSVPEDGKTKSAQKQFYGDRRYKRITKKSPPTLLLLLHNVIIEHAYPIPPPPRHTHPA